MQEFRSGRDYVVEFAQAAPGPSGPGWGRGRASGTFSSGMSAGGAVRRGESTRSLEEAAASQPGAQRQRRVAPGDAGASRGARRKWPKSS
jgi:hypothetical protein